MSSMSVIWVACCCASTANSPAQASVSFFMRGSANASSRAIFPSMSIGCVMGVGYDTRVEGGLVGRRFGRVRGGEMSDDAPRYRIIREVASLKHIHTLWKFREKISCRPSRFTEIAVHDMLIPWLHVRYYPQEHERLLSTLKIVNHRSVMRLYLVLGTSIIPNFDLAIVPDTLHSAQKSVHQDTRVPMSHITPSTVETKSGPTLVSLSQRSIALCSGMLLWTRRVSLRRLPVRSCFTALEIVSETVSATEDVTGIVVLVECETRNLTIAAGIGPNTMVLSVQIVVLEVGEVNLDGNAICVVPAKRYARRVPAVATDTAEASNSIVVGRKNSIGRAGIATAVIDLLLGIVTSLYIGVIGIGQQHWLRTRSCRRCHCICSRCLESLDLPSVGWNKPSAKLKIEMALEMTPRAVAILKRCTGAAAFGDRMHQQRVDWLGKGHPRFIVQIATAIDTVGLMVDTLESFARIGLKSDFRSLATQTANHNHLRIADVTLEPAKVSTFHAKMISRYIFRKRITPLTVDYRPVAISRVAANSIRSRHGTAELTHSSYPTSTAISVSKGERGTQEARLNA
ncbi:hypothetical protein KCU87_g557, partial [Aureobasidium melanogenum]